MNDAHAGHLRVIEAAATGLAYGGGLCWVSASMVASFRPQNLSRPYWSAMPALRTDTCGIAAFVTAVAGLGVSEYLRLRRRQPGSASGPQHPPPEPAALLATAAARTVTILSTALIIYISINSVTHPLSLALQATHLASWPTEGTLRVAALALGVFAVCVLRYLGARRSARPSGREAIRHMP